MNQRTTIPTKKLTKIFLSAAIGLIIFSTAASAQESLGYFMQEFGCDWLVGKWAGETTEGQKYVMEYKWQIKPHVLSVHFKGFDFEYHGIIFYKPAEEQVVQIGVDSNGGNGKGTWEAEDGKAIFKSEHADEYGEVSRMGFIYSKVDADTMKCKLYGLDQYGSLDMSESMTLEYKRVKTPAANKEKAKPAKPK
jgi:hypothetical protein